MLFGKAYYLASLEMTADGTCRGKLPRMRTHGIDLIAERLDAAIETIERKSSDLIGQRDETT